MNSKIKIGNRVTFTPTAWTAFVGDKIIQNLQGLREVTGTITQINEKHRYFRVRYYAFGVEEHECFKY